MNEPRTTAGKALLGAVQELQRVGQPLMADTARQMIIAIEDEARGSEAGLDVERLARAMALVHVTDHPIKEALEHWESYRTDATELAAAYGAVGDLAAQADEAET